MASRFHPLHAASLPLFLAGIAVVWSLAGWRAGRANEASVPRDILLRSGRILRDIEGDGALRLEAIDGSRLAGGGKAGAWLQVDGEEENGQYVGSVLWERRTDELLQIVHRPRAAAAEGGRVTVAQGARQALFWLRRIGVLEKRESAVSILPLAHTTQRLAYRVRWPGALADVSVFRHSGELALIDIDRSKESR